MTVCHSSSPERTLHHTRADIPREAIVMPRLFPVRELGLTHLIASQYDVEHAFHSA